MARPKKKISQKQFESLCAIQCTKEEICDVLDVTEKTLNNWCKETYGVGFSLVFSQKRALGKASLRRNQWKLAEKGNSTMLIWLRKQILKQSESPTQDEIKLKEIFAFKQKGLTSKGEVDGSFVLYKYIPKVYSKIKSKGIDSIDDIFEKFK